jgi:hypothetical protein
MPTLSHFSSEVNALRKGGSIGVKEDEDGEGGVPEEHFYPGDSASVTGSFGIVCITF